MSRPTERFDHDAGWVALERFLSADEVATILRDCAALLALAPEQRWAGDKPAAGTHHLTELDARIPLVEQLIGQARLTDVINEVLGESHVRDQVSYRSPQPSFGSQFLHADDVPKTTTAPDSVATAIIALTDFTQRNGATRVLPGSHRRSDLQRRSGSLKNHPEERLLTGAAGTAFVFSGHLLHSGTTNQSDTERPALQLVWRRF